MIKKLFIGAIIVAHAGLLDAMISYSHTETDNGEQLFVVGDVHNLDQYTEPGLSKRLMQPLVRVLGEITPPHRLPVILEMSHEVLKSGRDSVVAPLCQELCGLYRALLQKSENPLFLKLVDERSIESDFYHALSSKLSDIIFKHVSEKQIDVFSTRPHKFKEKKGVAATCLAELKRFMKPADAIPKTDAYVRSLDIQQKKLASIADRWQTKQKVAAYLAKALASHREAIELTRKHFAQVPADAHLWVAMLAPFFTQTTTLGILKCYDELESLNKKTNYLFHEICLLNAILECFEEGHKGVALFIGDVHAGELTALFTRETEFAWKRVAHKTCLEPKRGLGVAYSIERDFEEQIATAASTFIDAYKKQENSKGAFKNQCYQCFSSSDSPMNLCGGCKKAIYCCRDCQVKDWPQHKEFCRGQ